MIYFTHKEAPQSPTRTVHNIVVVLLSASLAQLKGIIHDSLEEVGVQEKERSGRTVPVRFEGDVEFCLTVHWGEGGKTVGTLRDPWRTRITQKNVGAVLSYLQNAAGVLKICGAELVNIFALSPFHEGGSRFSLVLVHGICRKEAIEE